MSSKPFEEFPSNPEEPLSEETPFGRSEEPPQRENDTGEGREDRFETPQRTTGGKPSSEEGSLSFQEPWDGNQYAIVASGEEPSPAEAAGPRTEAALDRDAGEATSLAEAPPRPRGWPRVRLPAGLAAVVGSALFAIGAFLTVLSYFDSGSEGQYVALRDAIRYGAILLGLPGMVAGIAAIMAGRETAEIPIPLPSRRVVRELVETVVLALLIFVAVRAAVQNFQVEGSSMDPGLADGQFLLVNKLIYARLNLDGIDRFIPFVDLSDGSHHIFRAPRRGDVVVFRFPGDPSRDFIKRIMGVPGDTVEVKDGTVFIDGQPLDEPYLTHKPNYVVEPLTVPPGQYFVLGDNRPGSFDSHSWLAREPTPDWPNPPFIPEENIIGQAWLSYWPRDVWGLAPNKSLSPSAP
jgi:signal peptidase I